MTTQLFIETISARTPCPNAQRGPSTERVRSFIRRVEQQDYCGAIAHFYHPGATAQENNGAIRRGRDALIAHEMDLLVRYGQVPCRKVERFAINGTSVFINWVFELRQPDGNVIVLDEVAMQEWDGDRIIRERFYYDPAQLQPST